MQSFWDHDIGDLPTWLGLLGNKREKVLDPHATALLRVARLAHGLRVGERVRSAQTHRNDVVPSHKGPILSVEIKMWFEGFLVTLLQPKERPNLSTPNTHDTPLKGLQAK